MRLADLVLLVNYGAAILDVVDIRAFDNGLQSGGHDFDTPVDNLFCYFLGSLFL